MRQKNLRLSQSSIKMVLTVDITDTYVNLPTNKVHNIIEIFSDIVQRYTPSSSYHHSLFGFQLCLSASIGRRRLHPHHQRAPPVSAFGERAQTGSRRTAVVPLFHSSIRWRGPVNNHQACSRTIRWRGPANNHQACS